MTPGRLGIGIVGAGRAGAVVGAALAGAGHAIVGVSATSDESRERADVLLPGAPLLDVPTLVERSELVILGVPDAELPGLIEGLAAAGGWQPGQIAIHLAADYGLEVFAPAAAQGVIPIALHPLIEFTGTSMDLVRLREALVAVTAPNAVLPIGQALAVELGAEPVVIAESDRPAFATTIARARDYSRDIVGALGAELAAMGVERPDRALGPLLRSAVDNALADALLEAKRQSD